jgi:hypothetical protein
MSLMSMFNDGMYRGFGNFYGGYRNPIYREPEMFPKGSLVHQTDRNILISSVIASTSEK